MAYSPQTAAFADIAIAIRDRLSQKLDLDPSYVRIVASDDYEVNLQDTKFIYIRYFGPQPFTDAGAGRRAMPVTRRIRLYLYTRNSLDLPGDDTLALTDPDLGHSAFEEAALNQCVNWFPQSNAESPVNLTIEPLHPVDSSGGPPVRKPEDDRGFIRSHLDFEARYLLKISIDLP